MPDLPFDPSSDTGCLEILEEVAELPALPALQSELSRTDIPTNELSKAHTRLPAQQQLDLQPHIEPSAATSSPPSPGCRSYASGSPSHSSSPPNLLRKRKSEQALCALISKDDEDQEGSWSHMIDPGECDFASDGTSDEGSWSQDWSLYDGESTMVMEKGSVARPKPAAGGVRRCRWMQAGVSPKKEVQLQTRRGDQACGREDGVMCVGKELEATSAFSLGRSSSTGPTSQQTTSYPTAAEAAGRASSPKGTLYPLGASAGLRFPPGCDGMEIPEGETTPAPGWYTSTGGFAYGPIAVSPNVVEGVQ